MASYDATAAGPGLFNPYEAIAIRLGASDPRRSGHDVGPLRQWIDWLTGTRRAPRLADAHLEALRRLALELRHRSRRGASAAMRAARQAGVSDRQIAALAATWP